MASSTLKFRVALHHDKATFACLARHAAFERPSRWPHLLAKEPQSSLQLQVVYPPEIRLTPSENLQPVEGEAFGLKCELIRAFPEQVHFEWFLDDELVLGANEPLLQIDSMPRFLRQIKCQASNSAGSSVDSLEPAIQYGVTFVGHLLQNNTKEAGSKAAKSKTSLQEQLAFGFELGQSFNVSCAFDAYPRPHTINWFKVSTGYADMKHVSPDQADQLIERGMSPEAFLQKHSRQTQLDYDAISAYWNSQWQTQQLNQDTELANNEPIFDKLPNDNSRNIIFHEASNNSHNEPFPFIANALLPSNQLAWFYQTAQANVTLNNTSNGRSKLVFLSDKVDLSEKQHVSVLRPRDKRPALITYSKYEIQAANEDAMGFYVCHANQLLRRHFHRQASRSMFVVARKKPRIVSTPTQSGQLGSRDLKIDCLIQVNTLANSNTSNSVRWYKDNKVSLTSKHSNIQYLTPIN